MANANNTVKILGALLLGTAIGGALGLLLAPNKGSDTRKKIKAKGNDLTSAVKDKFNNLVGDLKHDAEVMNDKVNETVKKAASKV